MKLTTADKLILAGSKLHLTEKDIQRIENLIPLISKWNSFTDMAIQNGVGPLIHKNISYTNNFGLIPEESLSRLKQTYYRSLSRNMILYEHFSNAIEAFSKEGISVIALKGIFLAEAIYQDIGLRQMTDIDLLVKKEDIEKCRKILMDMGYKYSEHYKSDFIKQFALSKHLPPLVLNGVSIELHSKIHLDNPEFSVNIDDYWKRSQQITLSNILVQSLSIEDLIQHLCLHLHEHFNGGNSQLHSFVDISELIKKYSSKINWDSLLGSCKLYNCSNIVFKYILLIKKYFDVMIPENIMNKANSVIDVRTEKLFIYYLQHFRKDIPFEISNKNIETLGNLRGFKNKFFYLLDDLFPSRTFMYRRYEINKKYLLFWFYILRFKTGIYRLLMQIIKQIISLAKPPKKNK
ncbi:MAG: nucleotidyltransferase family protein [Bacteroidetes bacterium]|nr:nucleotidyltransferase family protein [Bacteroidota bacterium]